MCLRKSYFFIALIFAFQPDLSYAGGWPQPKGGQYLKLSEWWLVSDKHYDSNGNVQNNIVEHGYYATILYGEYGLGGRVTALIYFPFINYAYTILPSSRVKQSILKTGDADVGLKYSLLAKKQIAVNTSLILGLPLGYNENGALLTGDGEFNQMIGIDALKNYKFFKSNAWVGGYGRFNNRSKEYADEFHFGLETGIDISKDKLTVVLRVDGIEALGNGENAKHINPVSLFSNFKEYLIISPEVLFRIDDTWGVNIGMGMMLTGKNIFSNKSFSVGIFKHKKAYKEDE